MRFRRFAALAVALALVVGTAGCTWFNLPDPPAELVAAADAYAAEVRAVPGVASAEAEVRATDPFDEPDEWTVALRVQTVDADGLATVPAAVSGIRPPSAATIRVALLIPAGDGAAAVSLLDPRDGSVERAEVLRGLPSVTSVYMSGSDGSVQIAAGTPLATAVAAIRASGTLTADPLDSVGVSLLKDGLSAEVSLAGPSDAVVDLMASVRRLSSVESVSSYEISEQAPRPLIRVSTTDPDRALALLTGFVEDQHEGRPRTRFDVSTDTDYISGYVGLPLGATEPDDLPTPTPPPVDEEALAAALAEDTTRVTEFLNAAVEASGLPGTPEVFVTECSSPAGSRVQGTLFLPTQTADDPYAAIVESWESDGYTHSDQAMGTSAYSPTGARPVVQATIRGTSEGIRVGAIAGCRG